MLFAYYSTVLFPKILHRVHSRILLILAVHNIYIRIYMYTCFLLAGEPEWPSNQIKSGKLASVLITLPALSYSYHVLSAAFVMHISILFVQYYRGSLNSRTPRVVQPMINSPPADYDPKTRYSATASASSTTSSTSSNNS